SLLARRLAQQLAKAGSSVESEKRAEFTERGARRAKTVGWVGAVAVADRNGAKQHVLRRNREKLADGLVHPRPGFLRAGIEPVATRKEHEGVDVAAEVGPLARTELALDGDEDGGRRIEELEIAFVLGEPALRAVAGDIER